MEDFNINKTILDAMEIMIANAFKNLDFDKTRTARISAVLENNKYSIIFDGETYTVTSENSYAVNDLVNVLIKQNDMKNLFLLPKSSSGKIHISNEEPTAADGNEGDIWFVYEE